MSSAQTTVIHVQDAKGPLVAGLLTFFFGPIGLLYTSPIAALVLIVLSIILVPLTIGLAALIIWPTSIVWGVVSAMRSQSKQSAAIHKATAKGSTSDPVLPVAAGTTVANSASDLGGGSHG